ncbi:alpha/beta hydrolase [Microbacterium invictum]|uniref:Acetyl esterase/lipase n=1 Tax=Microbacterium invictum TaxID=515415 RepID=A0AA40SS44_9MICO|nr:alpha/beta hydrolase [Microbacterium invictum]MBB4141412.1 acetyl esterase/lipase [Microbacterium invictum]
MTNVPETSEHTLKAAGCDFRVRVYPADRPNGAVLVWLHGGAFMFGTIDMPEADEVACRLSGDGVTVVSVDYTLAPLDALDDFPPPALGDGGPSPDVIAAELAAAGPRAPFPTASLQAVAAVSWARQNAARWGGDPARISIGGASAGGNLAASAAVRIRDDGAFNNPASLLLIYPLLHHEIPEPDDELRGLLDALPQHAAMPPEVGQAIARGYLGGASPHDIYAFPGGHDMRGMPRTLIVNAEQDALRASGEAFAADLARSSVDVTVVREPGTQHGYLNVVGHPGAERTFARMRWVLSSD